MDIGKAFGFVTQDESWLTKVLIGGLLIWIPIVNFAVIGYMLKVAENVARGNPRPLPEWSEFGDLFMRGLYGFVIELVYLIPAGVLYFLFFCVLAAAGSRSENGGGGAIGLLGLCLLPIIFILALLGYLAAFAALARYVATNSLSEAFKFNEVIANLRTNAGTWLTLLLVVILAGIVGGLGGIACGVGALFTTFYAQCVVGHALGQVVAQQGAVSSFDQAVPPSYGPPPSYQ